MTEYFCRKIIVLKGWNQGCTGQPFFASGRGAAGLGAEEKKFGAGQGENARGEAGYQLNPGAFSGWGGA